MKTPKENVEVLDAYVENHQLDVNICPNYSKHWDNARLSSDLMFDHDSAFMVKRVANKEFGKENQELRTWSHAELKEFYDQHNIGSTYEFGSLIGSNAAQNNGGLRDWYFAGRSARYMSVLEFRWNNGYAFTSYRERVVKALECRGKDAVNDLTGEAKKAQALLDARDKLRDETDTMIRSGQLSAQLAKVLDSLDITIEDVMDSEESDDS